MVLKILILMFDKINVSESVAWKEWAWSSNFSWLDVDTFSKQFQVLEQLRTLDMGPNGICVILKLATLNELDDVSLFGFD